MIPHNDDGVWRWIIHPQDGNGLDKLDVFLRPVYPTCDQAIEAVKHVIDDTFRQKTIAADSVNPCVRKGRRQTGLTCAPKIKPELALKAVRAPHANSFIL